jgi:hypothetical protein
MTKSDWAETVFYILIVLGSSAGAWFLPDEYLYVVFFILAAGVFFDVLSLFYHTMTIITGKFMSGFPLVGLFFYVWFLLACPFAVVAPKEAGLWHIVLYKLVDAAILVVFHALCQVPMFFQRPREPFTGEPPAQ